MKALSSVISVILLLFLMPSCSQSDTNSDKEEVLTAQEPAPEYSGAAYRDIPFTTIEGDTTSLADFDGKVVLVVNVASKCGYTGQYSGLEELYRKYRDTGLVVVGFPANNFGNQEPGSNEEILNFCQANFDVTFPMMAKISVKGDDKHPLYTYFTEQSSLPGEIKWNFSKFLLDREGSLAARFDSPVRPMSDEMIEQVEKLL